MPGKWNLVFKARPPFGNHELNGAGRGSRTPKGRSPADFESAASASSAIPALGRQEKHTQVSTFSISRDSSLVRY